MVEEQDVMFPAECRIASLPCFHASGVVLTDLKPPVLRVFAS